MKNIKCVIRKGIKNSNQESVIYIRYTYNRKFILINTRISVKPYLFNKETGRIKKSDLSEEKNNFLRKKELEIEKIVIDILNENKEPTLINVKLKYIENYNQNNNQQNNIDTNKIFKINEISFLKSYQEFIDYKDRYNKVGKETIKTYYSTLKKLRKFQEKTNYLLSYNSINQKFYDEFTNYLYGQNLLDNSVDKYIKNLKLFMKYTMSKGFHKNLDYLNFKRTKIKTDFVVLTQFELREIYRYKFTDTFYDRIRDLFLLGCSTGLRFGDLTKLNRGNFIINREPTKERTIKEGVQYSYIEISTNKTKQKIKIPLNKFICELIEKYDIENKEITFNKITNQEFNKHIKDVCNVIGINSQISISKNQRGNYKTEQKPKYEFISSHTMRRTFISFLSHYVSISDIQSVSGHKDIKILSDYIKHDNNSLNNIQSIFDTGIYFYK